MGFSLTGTHIIYFIASVIIASAVSGVLITITNNISTSLTETGERIQDQLDYEFKIINDPDNIPIVSSNYQFYLKNIGGKELATSTTEFNLFVDGEIIAAANYSFAASSIQVGEATTISVATSEISSGNHKLRVVGPQAVEDEFAFDI
jgi:archaeal flagellar protein FlaG